VDVMAAAVEIGGTITVEHGIGRLKRDALPTQLGPEVLTANRLRHEAPHPQASTARRGGTAAARRARVAGSEALVITFTSADDGP
ncbi:FAD-linked oxidase C-terminal domain-containing protein, partial [Janibacter melonis]|uniref:FAD-linked oxidase C-terminal domain-containing protein n=1 Tax=Janibacter melonis TaxID=262209 RepID=UPI00296B0854|nr:hypothetical protein [Janibacter melonis]